MRGPERVAIAVRKPDGKIMVKSRPFQSITARLKFLAIPFLRGAVVLVETLILGIKALTFSSDVAMEADNKEEKSRWQKLLGNIWMGVTLIVSFALGLGLFFYVPLIITGLFHLQSGILFNLVDGFFRLIIFLLYIYAITMWKEIRRVFEYHGAEHKSIYAFEDKKDLVIESAIPYSTLHPRCGTSFLLIVMLVSILVFMFLGKPETIGERLIRLAFIPLIGGISYELIKLSDKANKFRIFRIFILPGLWLQKLTTKEPDESQLEVAIVALKSALGFDPDGGPSEIEICCEETG